MRVIVILLPSRAVNAALPHEGQDTPWPLPVLLPRQAPCGDSTQPGPPAARAVALGEALGATPGRRMTAGRGQGKFCGLAV
jgi:hypothetical protein